MSKLPEINMVPVVCEIGVDCSHFFRLVVPIAAIKATAPAGTNLPTIDKCADCNQPATVLVFNLHQPLNTYEDFGSSCSTDVIEYYAHCGVCCIG